MNYYLEYFNKIKHKFSIPFTEQDWKNFVIYYEKGYVMPTTITFNRYIINWQDHVVVEDATMASGNVYQTSGGGNDGQYQFFKLIALQGKTRTGELNTWKNNTAWTLTTEYFTATGSQTPLYNGLEITASLTLMDTVEKIVKSGVNPTLDVDGYGAKTIYRYDTFWTKVENNIDDYELKLDYNYLSYRSPISFVYHKPLDCWLIKHQKLGLSTQIIMPLTYLHPYGYIDVTNGYTLDESLYPFGYQQIESTFGWTNGVIPNTINTSIVGRGTNSPEGQVTKGQAGDDITGSFEITPLAYTVEAEDERQHYMINSMSGTGIFKNMTSSIVDGNANEQFRDIVSREPVDDYPYKKWQRITLNSDTGKETLTRRIGSRVYYVI